MVSEFELFSVKQTNFLFSGQDLLNRVLVP